MCHCHTYVERRSRNEIVVIKLKRKNERSVQWGSRGGCDVASALEKVTDLLRKYANDAPMGSVVVDILCFVRLMGEGVLLARRRLSCVRGEIGSLVGNWKSARL